MTWQRWPSTTNTSEYLVHSVLLKLRQSLIVFFITQTPFYFILFYLLPACLPACLQQITDPGVLDLQFRLQTDDENDVDDGDECERFFEWGLPDPGEPQLPGGLVDSVVDALNEVRH